MTTFEERFYETPYGWFRREGVICGRGAVSVSTARDWAESHDRKNTTTEPITVDARPDSDRPAAISGRWK